MEHFTVPHYKGELVSAKLAYIIVNILASNK